MQCPAKIHGCADRSRWSRQFDSLFHNRRALIPRILRAPRLYVLVAAGLLSSCATPPWKEKPPTAGSSEEVGDIYVSAYPVVAWADIAAQLAPNRGWKIGDAQNAAVNVTSAQTLQAISSLSAALGLNFSTTASTVTAGQNPSQSSTQSSGVVPATPALALPGASQAPAVPALTALSGLSVTPGDRLLLASDALFKQAAILDNQITDQYLPLGYAAHLLTFQINLQPTRTNWSYNAYVDITLMPSPLQAAFTNSTTAGRNVMSLPPVIIKPLIITDALQGSSDQRSIQEITQALAQLSGSISRAGTAALFASAQNALQTSAGYNINSLVTSGMVDDATIRVRLGAERDGSGHLALATRTYNISLMVLTKSGDPGDSPTGIGQLSAVTHAFFSPTGETKTGSVIPGQSLPELRTRPEVAKQVDDDLRDYDYTPLEKDCGQMPPNRPPRTSPFDIRNQVDIETNLIFLLFVTHGDYMAVKNCLRVVDAPTITDQERMYRLMSELSEIQNNTRYSDLTIPLKNDGTPRLPDSGQYALVSDSADGSQQTVTLQGGRNLMVDQLHPRATLSDNKNAWLLPTNIVVSTTMQPSVAITFSSPSTLQPLGEKLVAGTASTPASSDKFERLEIVLGTDHGQQCESPTHQCYTSFLHVSSSAQGSSSSNALGSNGPTPAATGNAAEPPCKSTALPLLSTATTTLRWSKDSAGRNTATVNLSIGDVNKIVADCSTPSGNNSIAQIFKGPFYLTVSNADVEVPPGIASSTPPPCIGSSGNQLMQLGAVSKCIATLTLFNLADDVPVSFAVTDSNKKTLPSARVTLRVLRVERSR